MLVPTIVLVLLIGVYFMFYVVIVDHKETPIENKIKELNVLNLILFFVICCYISYFFGGVYDNVERAHRVYLKFRKEMVKDIMEIYGDSVDERVCAKLLETCEPEYYGYS